MAPEKQATKPKVKHVCVYQVPDREYQLVRRHRVWNNNASMRLPQGRGEMSGKVLSTRLNRSLSRLEARYPMATVIS